TARATNRDPVGFPFVSMPRGSEGRAGPTVDGSDPVPALRPSSHAQLPALAVAGRRKLLGCQELDQIRHFEERPYLDLARPRCRIGATLRPGHGLVHVLDLPDREAGDQLA